MTYYRVKKILFALMALLLVPLAGEVFLSFPKSGKKNNIANRAELPAGAEILWHDNSIKVNGIAGVLTAGKTESQQLLAWIKALKSANIWKRTAISGQKFIKLSWQNAAGQYHRWLFIDGGTKQPITFFHLETDLPVPSASEWPKNIPRFNGAKAAMVIESSAHPMTYCSFFMECKDGDLECALMADFCRSGNWTKLPGTSRWLQRPSTGEFLWFTLDNNGNGVCCVVKGGK